MAAILAQMDGDAIRPRRFGEQRRLDRVRIVDAADLAERGNVVDVDAEAKRGGHPPSPAVARSSPMPARAAAAIASASWRISASRSPSTITRSSGSVPE